jgi:rubrerythrin
VSTHDLTLMAAIELAKEAEQRAAELYEQAAGEASNPLVRRLLAELVEYERYHYQKLTELEASLQDSGAFIRYQERGPLPVEATSEVPEMGDVRRTSVAKVIKRAISFEQQAQERYAELAEKTTDPDGRDMFERLAREEHNHYLTLSRAYYDVGDFQVAL